MTRPQCGWHPEYGTRSASVLLWQHDGAWTLLERRFDRDGSTLGTHDASHR